MKPSFTLGIEEEYQTIDPATFDLRSHIHTELIAQGKRQLKEKVKAEMHQSVIEVGTGHLPEHRRSARGRRQPAAPDDRARQGARAAAGRRRDASVRRLARAGHLSRRALPAGRRGHADGRALEPDLRPARARRHRGSRDQHSPDEPAALLPAASARALDQLAVLARHEHRAEVVPLQGVRQVPAHEHSRHVHELGRLRELRQPADPHQLHRQRQADLVGRPAASVLLDARSPHLRHPDARRRNAGHRRADPGDARQAVQAALAQSGAAASTAAR